LTISSCIIYFLCPLIQSLMDSYLIISKHISIAENFLPTIILSGKFLPSFHPLFHLWFWAEAKLNNSVYIVYTWRVVCTLELINTRGQAGISRGFVDYFENEGHTHTKIDTHTHRGSYRVCQHLKREMFCLMSHKIHGGGEILN
jgi:hypothetical protein